MPSRSDPGPPEDPTRQARKRFMEAAGGVNRSGLAGGLGRIYALGLALLAVIVFMLIARERMPRAVEKALAPQAPPDAAQLAARHAELEKLLGGAYLDPPDGTGFVETEGYARLLQVLNDHVRPGDVVKAPPPFDRQQALETPDLQRGQTVRIQGVVAGVWAQKLDNPVFQQEDVWRTFITDNDGEDGVVVDIMQRPPALEQRRDTVTVDAVFYRLVAYEPVPNQWSAQRNRDGKLQRIPYLLARSLAVDADAARSAPSLMSHPASLVIALALACIFAWGVFRAVAARRRPPIRWRAPRLELPANRSTEHTDGS